MAGLGSQTCFRHLLARNFIIFQASRREFALPWFPRKQCKSTNQLAAFRCPKRSYCQQITSSKFKLEMEDDDFEYYVNFPSPEIADHNNADTDKITSNSFYSGAEETAKPAIILLGWGGGSDRHLSKYSDIYNSRGIATLRYVSPSKYVFMLDNVSSTEQHAIKLVEAIQDLGLEEHPIIFHSFSNSGANMYHLICSHLKSIQNTSIQIQGCIFDSGPAKVGFWGRVEVLSTLTPGSTFKRYAMGFFTATYQYATRLLHMLFFWRPKKYLNPWNHTWKELSNEDSTWPQMFLYSKSDTLCGYRSIEAFIRKRKQKGVNVTTVFFEDSPHVGHLKLHRETYINQIFNFVRKCLSNTFEKDKMK